jgi:DNA-binding transcriptional MerR regulator
MSMPLYIGTLAQRAGLTRSTLRYYERIGLLAPSARTASGYRVFDERALVDLAFVRRGQALGFTLEEVRGFLQLHRRGDSPCERVVATARRRLAEVDTEMERMTAFRDFLAGQIASWTSCAVNGPLDGPCALIERADESCRCDVSVADRPSRSSRKEGSALVTSARPGRRSVGRR